MNPEALAEPIIYSLTIMKGSQRKKFFELLFEAFCPKCGNEEPAGGCTCDRCD